MNNVKLSDRLSRVLDQIPAGSRLADIGSDHALLPVAAVQGGKAVSAIAGEVNPGPFEAAKRGVAEAGQGRVIDVRRGDGLEVLEAGEADCITVCGMGGALIAAILDRGTVLGKLQGVKTLVLQPNVGEEILRCWLVEHDWVLTGEQILEEDGKIYEILTAVREDAAAGLTNDSLYRTRKLAHGKLLCDRERMLQMGPWLLEAPNAVFAVKWRSELAKLESILQSLSRSELESAEEKRNQIRGRMTLISEVLACLPKVKP